MAVTRLEYEDKLRAAALKAAEERVKYNEEKLELKSYKNSEVKTDAEKKYFTSYLKNLHKLMPFDGITGPDLDALDKFGSEEMMRWVDGRFKGPSPAEKEKSIEASKFLPYVYGNAKEGESWFERSSEDLKGIASDLGYKSGTKEGFKEFLDKMGEYQQQFERGQNLKQFRKDMGGWYWPSRIAYPSMMQEGENAIATGEGGDPTTMALLGGVDALANTGIFLQPGIAGGRAALKNSPVLAGAVDAAMQAGIEAERQAAKASLSKTGQEFDIAAPFAAGAAGATRPALVGSANMLASQLPGGTAQQFARGISMATRKGDPVALERENMSKSLDILKNLVRVEGDVTAAEKNKLFAANKAVRAAKSLGVKTEDLLTEYDRPVHFLINSSPETGVSLMKTGGGVRDGIRFLDEEGAKAYAAAFPAKMDYLNGANPARTAGLGVGTVIADLGSRFEPAAKVNPYELITGNKYSEPPDYKQESWYEKLSDENKAIVDAAYKAKLNELMAQ